MDTQDDKKQENVQQQPQTADVKEPQEQKRPEQAPQAPEAQNQEAASKDDQPGKAAESSDQRRKPGRRSFRPRDRRPTEGASEFIEKVIKINRVAKVTKGGKKMSFSALVVVGDAKGHAGYALGKANDVASAIRKGMSVAKKSMITVPMQRATITHEIIGLCGAARVLLKPAAEGTGVIASGPVRAVCDAAGIRNILTKCHTTNNPLNVVKATINGFSRLKTKKE